MKVTAQEEYGLRCILCLARECPQGGSSAGSLTVSDMAEREGLSVQYAGKLIRILGKAGLVESVRGCKGGYRLARPAGEISVSETLSALGGRMFDREVCQRCTGAHDSCVHTSDCTVRSLWSGLQWVLDQVLNRTSLADLIGNEKTMAEWLHSSVEAINGGLASKVPTSHLLAAHVAGEGHPRLLTPTVLGEASRRTETHHEEMP